ncbi:MAG: mechanosensitive ion channel family protein [Cyanobacteriota bacterium]|nr:mechanosensitive ion channel family protein [Cyanobacteriota bacterium]
MLDQSILLWGTILILGFPILTIAIGEGIERARRRNNPISRVLWNLRQWVLPPLATLLVLEKIFGFTEEILFFRVIETLLLLAVGYTSISLLNAVLVTATPRHSWQTVVPNLLFQSFRAGIVLSVVAYILAAIWHIDLGQLATAAGVGSLVIALALQDTLSNLVSGFLLILESPFKMGDWIQVGEIEGEVIEINWRAVRLKTRDRDVVVIPNGSLGQETIQNYTLLDPLHGIRVLVRFSYFDPPNRVIQLLQQTAMTVNGVMQEPPPDVETQLYTNSAIEYEVKLYIKDFVALEDIRSEFLTRVYYSAKRYGFTLPYADKIEYKIDSFPREEGVSAEEIAASLKQLPYFAFLDRETLDRLAQSSAVAHFGIGERIVQAGEVDRYFYIIVQGSVLLSVKDSKAREQEVAFLSSGDIFGETIFLQGKPSLVSAMTIDDLKAIAIAPDVVLDIAYRYPRFAREMNQFIEARKADIRKAKGERREERTTTTDSSKGWHHPLLEGLSE